MTLSPVLRRTLPAAALLLAATTVPVVLAATADADVTTVQLSLSVGAVHDVDADGTTNPGDTIDFAFAVKNTGGDSIEITSLEAPLLNAAGITVTCPSDPVAPDATVACTPSGPYTITAADAEAGEVALDATVNGWISAQETEYSVPASLSVPVTPTAAPQPPTVTHPDPVALPDTGA